VTVPRSKSLSESTLEWFSERRANCDRDKAKPLHDALHAWSKDAELLKTLHESQPRGIRMAASRLESLLDCWLPRVERGR
jgi:hypothetical protein